LRGWTQQKHQTGQGNAATIIINASWPAPEAWYSTIDKDSSSFLHPIVVALLYSLLVHGKMDGIIFKVGTILRGCTQQKHKTGQGNMAAIIINASRPPPGAWYSTIANNFSSFLHPVVVAILYSPPTNGKTDGIIFDMPMLQLSAMSSACFNSACQVLLMMQKEASWLASLYHNNMHATRKAEGNGQQGSQEDSWPEDVEGYHWGWWQSHFAIKGSNQLGDSPGWDYKVA
jgi:hypothetical protein